MGVKMGYIELPLVRARLTINSQTILAMQIPDTTYISYIHWSTEYNQPYFAFQHLPRPALLTCDFSLIYNDVQTLSHSVYADQEELVQFWFLTPDGNPSIGNTLSKINQSMVATDLTVTMNDGNSDFSFRYDFNIKLLETTDFSTYHEVLASGVMYNPYT